MMNTIQTTGLDRDPIDKYYTKNSCSRKMYKFSKRYIINI